MGNRTIILRHPERKLGLQICDGWSISFDDFLLIYLTIVPRPPFVRYPINCFLSKIVDAATGMYSELIQRYLLIIEFLHKISSKILSIYLSKLIIPFLKERIILSREELNIRISYM